MSIGNQNYGVYSTSIDITLASNVGFNSARVLRPANHMNLRLLLVEDALLSTQEKE